MLGRSTYLFSFLSIFYDNRYRNMGETVSLDRLQGDAVFERSDGSPRLVYRGLPKLSTGAENDFRASIGKELSTPVPRFAFGAACAGVDNSVFLV
jgi:hypothetical protein